MGRFLTHESLAMGLFNANYNGSTSHISVWEGIMNNSEDVLRLLLDRMESDFLALLPKMRKHYQAAAVDS